MLPLILSVVIVLAVSFFCSLTEAVILSSDINAIPAGPGEKNRSQAALWKKLRNRIAKPIAAILILNTIANTGGAVISGAQFARIFGEYRVWLFTLIMTVAILFGAEILPKVIGVEYKRSLLPKLLRILAAITALLSPLIYLTELIAAPFRKRQPNSAPSITGADIISYAAAARSHRNIDSEQEAIIIGALMLRQKTVQEVMIPRSEIQYLINGISLEDNETRLGGVLTKTRYPVCETDDLDTIIGTINHKTLERYHGDQVSDFAPLVREAVYIGEQDSLLAALKVMRRQKRHLIFARDRAGVITGLLTLEDITDELIDVVPIQ